MNKVLNYLLNALVIAIILGFAYRTILPQALVTWGLTTEFSWDTLPQVLYASLKLLLLTGILFFTSAVLFFNRKECTE